MDKKLLKLLQSKKQTSYDNPNSILKDFDAFLESNGIYRSFNEELFLKQIRNRKDLIDFTLETYNKAILDNERELLLNCLLYMSYNKSLLAKMVLNIFQFEKDNPYLWHYGDFLYLLKDFSFLDDYINLIMDASYGQSREMIVLLVGESHDYSIIPQLIKLSNDDEILGHVLLALSNFTDFNILSLMKKNITNTKKWIADVAKNYVDTY